MKKIEAIIRPEKLDAVRKALADTNATGIMVTEIIGHGKQKGMYQQWRGEKYRVELLPKVKIEVVVKDADVKPVVKTIIDNASTGEIGDGKVFIYNIEDSIRIRTREHGEEVV